MARPRDRKRARPPIDEAELAAFRAGLRRRYTNEEILEELRRTPTARDLAERGRSLPSASLYAHTFGSLADALREAGFEVLRGEERLERAISQGAELARELGHLPRMADWKTARRENPALLSEWQVYRMLDVDRGAWTAFQFLVRERLREDGVAVNPDGTLAPERGS